MMAYRQRDEPLKNCSFDRSDPDATPLTEEEWEAVKPTLRAGRPVSVKRKVSTTIRFDADVLAATNATGPGWQTRINRLVGEHYVLLIANHPQTSPPLFGFEAS